MRKGNLIPGIGGFNHTTFGAKTIVVCSRFMAGSDVSEENGKLVFKDGHASKFCEKVDYINLNPEVMRAKGRRVVYVTECCVFQLCETGLELIEIAPDLDLEQDVLAKIPFSVKIADNLKVMPREYFIQD